MRALEKQYNKKMNTRSEARQDTEHKQITFAERSRCVNCGASACTPLWHGTFGDTLTSSYLEKFHYSVNVLGMLSEQEFSLARCNGCSMVFHQRVLTPEWLDVLYSQWIDDSQIDGFRAEKSSGSGEEAKIEEGKQMVKHVLRLQKLLDETISGSVRLLDYGCGDGKFLQCAALFGFEAHGVDFSTSRVIRAERAAITIVRDLKEFDANTPGRVHAVTLFQVLEHIVEPVQVLKQLASRLVEGGIIVVEVPDCSGITQPKNFEEFHKVHPLEHINAFTPKTLKQMCERLGFVAIPRPASHVTTSVIDLMKTELSRIVQPPRTAQYFRKA